MSSQEPTCPPSTRRASTRGPGTRQGVHWRLAARKREDLILGLSTRAPDARLQRQVECIAHSWDEVGDGSPTPAPVRVVPDGGIELLFSFEAKGGGRDAPLRRGGAARGDFFGARTRPLLVSGDGPVANVSARLRPGAARRFFDLAARELTDRSRDVATLWGDPGRRLTAEMARTTCWRERGRLLEGALLGRLDQAADREDEARVATAVAAIRRSGGRVPIAALCQRLGVGERRLERLFDAHVGLPPKTFARVVRFQRAHRRLLGGRAQGETAHVCGYADQAHMVRDFRRLAGETPGRLLPTRRR